MSLIKHANLIMPHSTLGFRLTSRAADNDGTAVVTYAIGKPDSPVLIGMNLAFDLEHAAFKRCRCARGSLSTRQNASLKILLGHHCDCALSVLGPEVNVTR